jgi:predicted nuclease of predicted toxin-antitoxin system
VKHADDQRIWDWAKMRGYIVITSDADFVTMSRRLGFPPKVIHIEQCDFPFRVIEDLLRRSAVRVTEFDQAGAEGVLTLRVPPAGDPR